MLALALISALALVLCISELKQETFLATDDNRKCFESKSYVTPHTRLVTHAKTGFLPSVLKLQKGGKHQIYFCSFLAFTAQSTIEFH